MYSVFSRCIIRHINALCAWCLSVTTRTASCNILTKRVDVIVMWTCNFGFFVAEMPFQIARMHSNNLDETQSLAVMKIQITYLALCIWNNLHLYTFTINIRRQSLPEITSCIDCKWILVAMIWNPIGRVTVLAVCVITAYSKQTAARL